MCLHNLLQTREVVWKNLKLKNSKATNIMLHWNRKKNTRVIICHIDLISYFLSPHHTDHYTSWDLISYFLLPYHTDHYASGDLISYFLSPYHTDHYTSWDLISCFLLPYHTDHYTSWEMSLNETQAWLLKWKLLSSTFQWCSLLCCTGWFSLLSLWMKSLSVITQALQWIAVHPLN